MKVSIPVRIRNAALFAIVGLAAAGTLTGCSGVGSTASLAPPASLHPSVRPGSNASPEGSVTHYSLVKLPTLGGSQNVAEDLNNRGQIGGASFITGNEIEHAEIWTHRHPSDLGTLGGPNSAILDFNHGTRGQFVGWSETSQTDPNAENFCAFGTSHICLGFSWRHGQMTSLPTLGGNNDWAADENNRGQILGTAETGTEDPSCVAPQVFDYYGVIWQPNSGGITTLPPYPGDTISYAIAMNRSGAAVGKSGPCEPISSSVAYHALLWQNGTTMNLGNLGGDFAEALDINNRGQIVGDADTAGNACDCAFLWQNGTMTNLGTLPGDVFSEGAGINDEGQIVGESCPASGPCRGFIWQNGTMTDLNLLTPPKTKLYVEFGADINNRGQIAGVALTPQGLTRAVLLVPESKSDVLPNGVPAPKVTSPENLLLQLRNPHVGLR